MLLHILWQASGESWYNRSDWDGMCNRGWWCGAWFRINGHLFTESRGTAWKQVLQSTKCTLTINYLHLKGNLQRSINLQAHVSLGCVRELEETHMVRGRPCKHHTGSPRGQDQIWMSGAVSSSCLALPGVPPFLHSEGEEPIERWTERSWIGIERENVRFRAFRREWKEMVNRSFGFIGSESWVTRVQLDLHGRRRKKPLQERDRVEIVLDKSHWLSPWMWGWGHWRQISFLINGGELLKLIEKGLHLLWHYAFQVWATTKFVFDGDYGGVVPPKYISDHDLLSMGLSIKCSRYLQQMVLQGITPVDGKKSLINRKGLSTYANQNFEKTNYESLEIGPIHLIFLKETKLCTPARLLLAFILPQPISLCLCSPVNLIARGTSRKRCWI